MPFGNFFPTPSHKKCSSIESRHVANNKRLSINATPSVAPVETPVARVRRRFSSIMKTSITSRRSSVLTLDIVATLDYKPRYSSSSDESSFQHPPTPPAHTISMASYMGSPHYHQPSTAPVSFAYQVKFVLGSTFDEVDQEINVEWDGHRKNLRQSLLAPVRPLSPTW